MVDSDGKIYLEVPDFGNLAVAKVKSIAVRCGERLERGATLLDLEVDLSAGITRDCPPLSTCRIVLAEPLRLEALHAEVGSELPPGARLAEFSSETDMRVRAARFTSVAIVDHADWWNEDR